MHTNLGLECRFFLLTKINQQTDNKRRTYMVLSDECLDAGVDTTQLPI